MIILGYERRYYIWKRIGNSLKLILFLSFYLVVIFFDCFWIIGKCLGVRESICEKLNEDEWGCIVYGIYLFFNLGMVLVE